MQLITMTSDEVKIVLQEKPWLLIPVGICEQHGPHLPLGTDTLTAEYFANQLGEKLDILVGPTVGHGVGLPLDLGFPGSTSLQPETLRMLLNDLLGCWRKQGFQRFLIITAHGDPFHLEVLQSLGQDTLLIDVYDTDISDLLVRQSCARHACEAETSLMLHLFPDMVRMDKARDYDIPYQDFLPWLQHAKSDLPQGYFGVIGCPIIATTTKGKEIVNRIITDLETQVKEWLV